MNAPNEGFEIQTMAADESMVAMISRAEIDQQITTAKKYPRSIKRFVDEATAMVTLNESIAQQCIYALPRDGKVVEGASARFGEIVASAWGNCRAGARVVNDSGEFVTAQGVFHDLERNVAITYEVQRRITNKQGRRFSADMIGVTANAACSIALRNAILKGVPKAFWEPMYQKARAVVAGDIKTLANKRAEAVKQFQIYGINEAQILAKLGREGIQDVTVDDLVVLFGLLTAMRDGDTTPEQAFTEEGNLASTGRKKEPQSYPAEQFAANLPGWRKAIADKKKTADQIIALVSSKGTLTEEQKAAIRAPAEQTAPDLYEQIKSQIEKSTSVDVLDVAADLIGEVSDPAQREQLTALYQQRTNELMNG